MTIRKHIALALLTVGLTGGFLAAQSGDSKEETAPTPQQQEFFMLTQRCIHPSGEIFLDGEIATFFKAEKECSSTTKTCNQGIWEGSDEFLFATCPTLDTERANCERNETTIPEFSTVTVYEKKLVSRDQRCSYSQKICVGGSLVGPSDFSQVSCQFNNTFSAEHKNNNSENYDRIGNIKPESLLVPPTGKGQSCTTQWGETIPSGEAVLSFDKQYATLQGVCDYSLSVCINGTFDKPTQAFSSCQPTKKDTQTAQELSSCLEKLAVCEPAGLPDKNLGGQGGFGDEPCEWYGDELQPGEQITAFQKGFRQDGEYICPKETRICIDGQLSGTYQEKIWDNPGRGPHRCPSPVGPIEHGNAVTLYSQGSVRYPGECLSQTRECKFGKLQGSEEYNNADCEQIGNRCELPSGGSLAHGASTIGFSREKVPYGESCDLYAAERECIDGRLTESSSYKYNICENEQPKNCAIPGGGTLQHGQTLTLYQYSSVPGSVETQGQDICPRQSRQCNNGVLSNLEGNVASFTYTFSNCEVIPPGSNISN